MTDRLDRLERHLDDVLAGPRRLMRSLSKTTTGKAMKVHRVTLFIIDFHQVGAEGLAEELANAHYGNDCISPNVLNVETREIGEWDDSHPLNRASTAADEVARIFGESALTKAEELLPEEKKV